MKKIITILMCIFGATFLLTGCGNASQNQNSTKAQELKQEYDKEIKAINADFDLYEEYLKKEKEIFEDKSTPWCGKDNRREQYNKLYHKYGYFGKNKDQYAAGNYFVRGSEKDYPDSFWNTVWKDFQNKWKSKASEGNFTDTYNNDVKNIEQRDQKITEFSVANGKLYNALEKENNNGCEVKYN